MYKYDVSKLYICIYIMYISIYKYIYIYTYVYIIYIYIYIYICIILTKRYLKFCCLSFFDNPLRTDNADYI